MQNKEHTTPTGMIVGHLPSVKKADALDYIRAQSDKYLMDYGDGNIYYDMMQWRDGYLFIVTVGGDKLSRLKSLANFLDEKPPGTKVRFDTAHRHIEVFLKPNEDQRLVMYIMPEDDTLDGITPLEPKGKMSKLQSDYRMALGIGAVVFACGVLFMTGTAIIMNMDAASTLAKERASVSDMQKNLPSWHLPSTIALAPGQYIQQMRFSAGKWQPPVMKCATKECEERTNPVPLKHDGTVDTKKK